MAIKAIINNTEKEIEQIKNSDEQDIDYVYSRIGDTEVEGEPPISIKSIGGELANYRIYGNTVDGESVGDRTGNLFDGIFLQGYWAYADGVWTQVNTWIATKKIPCKSSTTYTFSFNRVSRWYGFAWFDFSGNYISYNAEQNYSNIQYRSFSAVSPPNAAYMAIDVAGYPDTVNTIFPNDITDFMLVEGSTALPYEPYGYKVPVTVEGINILPMSTTPISTDVDDFHCEYDGTGTITLTTDKDNAVLSSFNIPLSEDFIVPVSIGQGGDGCVQFNNSISASLNSNTDHICVSFYYNSTFIDSWGLTTINRRHSTYSSMGGKTINRVVIDIKGTGFSTNRKIVIRPALVLNTTEQVPFEPYHAPVTTPIYLPEPIKKVGDEAEYIDYGEQKLHRVRKNLLKNTAKDREIDVTFTVNSDGSVTCNGTASAKVSSDRIPLSLPAGSYYLNGTPSGGSLSTYHMFVWYYNDEFELIWYNDIGDGVSFTIDNSYDVNVGIEIISGYTCNNLTFYPMIRKADIEDDTYEPYIENTDLDVTLPALSTIKGTNTFSVNTSIQPSNMYIKDNFDYKKVFTATRTIEGESPLNYKNIEDNDSTLSNYRIYGNTVGGESVGDRTGNLFDMKTFAETAASTNATVNYSENSLIFTPKHGDAYVNGVFSQGNLADKCRPSCINVHPLTTYTISMNAPYKCYITWIDDSFNVVDAYTKIPSNQPSYTFTTPSNCTKLHIRLGKQVTNIGDTFTISNVMLNEGSTALPYEPYGYKVPATVSNGTDTQTIPIYLPEQIRKVGDEAEYVDYKEQKQHRVRKNLLPNTATSQTINGVTYTVNEDGSITCNGTATNATEFTVRLDFLLSAGNYRLTGCPSGGGFTSYYLRAWYRSSGGVKWLYDFGSGCDFTLTDTVTMRNSFVIEKAQVVDNITFYPMIRKADIEDDTYEPYIENVDIDVTLPALPTVTGTNVLSVGTAVQPSGVEIKGKIKEIN